MIHINKTQEPEVNMHFLAVSRRYKIAKLIVLFFLVMYLLVTIALYRDKITVENFQYIMKYLDVDSPEYSGNYRTIYYDASNERRVGLYKGELAVVTGSAVNLYNMLGNNILNYNTSYSQPVLHTSKSYMLVYALGEKAYSINNTLSQLYTETYEYPIQGAALSDSGMYAIVSKTLEYRSAVYIYDRDFNKITQILKDKLVMDVEITSNGDEVLLLSVYNKNGDFRSEIMTCNPYSDVESSIETLEGVFAVKAGYNSEGGYSIICDSKILFYDKDNKRLAAYSYDGLVPVNYLLSEKYTAIAFNKNIVGNDNDFIIFDNSGKSVYSGIISGKIYDIASDGIYVYVLLDNLIIRIDPQDGAVIPAEIEGSALNLLVKDMYTLIVCYNQKSMAYMTENLFVTAPDEE